MNIPLVYSPVKQVRGVYFSILTLTYKIACGSMDFVLVMSLSFSNSLAWSEAR